MGSFFTGERVRVLLFAVMIAAVLLAMLDRFVVLDRSAERTGDGFVWHGETYVAFDGTCRGGKRLAKTSDGFDILAVEGDSNHDFLLLSDFTDAYLCVREGLTVPSDGVLTGVQLKSGKILSGTFTDTIDALRRNFSEERRIETTNIHTVTDTQHMAELAFYYENSPVGIRDGGWYLGLYEGAWVIARQAAFRDADGSRIYTYALDTVPDELVPTLEKLIK